MSSSNAQENWSQSEISHQQSKRDKRLKQNRASASRLRVKKKQNYERLQQEKEISQQENTNLRRKVRIRPLNHLSGG